MRILFHTMKSGYYPPLSHISNFIFILVQSLHTITQTIEENSVRSDSVRNRLDSDSIHRTIHYDLGTLDGVSFTQKMTHVTHWMNDTVLKEYMN